MPDVPLRRNRDFLLLQLGQLLSAIGVQMTAIAYPLLVLAETHSAAKAGIVGFARVVPYPVCGLLAGAAADRWNRKALMIGSDAVRALAVVALAATVAVGSVEFWLIVAVSLVDGAGSSFFAAAQAGALRSVVPAKQMPAAIATVTGRQSVVLVAGPPVGGALFTVGHAVPFVVDAVSYAFSTVSLLLMRTPFQEERERAGTRLLSEITEGLRWLWDHSFLRTCSLLFGIGNLVFPGLSLVIVVVGTENGLTGGEIGLLAAVFGACLLVGSALSAFTRRTFSVRTILLMELWTWTGCAVFLVWPNVYVLTASILPTMLTVPSTDSVVHGYRTAMTPDRLIGRVDSAARTISLLAAPLGPLLAGVLLSATSERWTVGVFALFGLVLALWGTLSESIRNAPSLTDLEHAPRGPASESA